MSWKALGRISRLLKRVEFQQRGSPHIYAFVWVKGVPAYGKPPDDNVVHFVDKYVTCKNSQSEMKYLVNLQLHGHAKTCMKLGNNVCRFNFSLPAMKGTVIL